MTEPLLLTVDQARHLAGAPGHPLGRGTAYDLAREGVWQTVHVGRRVLVVRASVEAWVHREAARNRESP